MSIPSLTKEASSNSSFQDLPTLIDESLIRPFKFWDWGIKVGMIYNSDLYMFCESFRLQQRLQAYDAGYQKIQKGQRVCITASKTSYSVWMTLQALLETQNPS
ncbi:MAG: hypothetical protein SFW36_02700 [Leptolyngbyaceae cyanobacterium bins.59]|nr:hypothetical protein [Leptolyngbyaceae cyanobacterium bins.59]